MKRAIIYARVSTGRQAEEGLSIDSQIEACRRRADRLGVEVVQVFQDRGVSGTTDARPAFQAAVARCVAGGIDVMLVWSSSRFARDVGDAIHYERRLEALGVRLLYADSEVDPQTRTGMLTVRFMQVIDEFTSRKIGEDTTEALMKAARDGFFTGGRVPYGYQVVPDAGGKRRRLVPADHEAEVVRMVFGWAAEGLGALAIARRLNDDGLSMRGRPWRKNSILYLLKSEVYMGRKIYNRTGRKAGKVVNPPSEWVRVQAHTPLVQDEQWHAVQGRIADRAPDNALTQPTAQHVFAGLLRCGLCQSSLQMMNGTSRNGRLYHYYACRGHRQGVRCAAKPVPAEPFDRMMLDELMNKVLTPEALQLVINGLDEAMRVWVRDRALRRQALALELRQVEDRRLKLFNVLETAGTAAADLAGLLERGAELKQRAKALDLALQAIEEEPEPDVVGGLQVSAQEAAQLLRASLADVDDIPRLREFVSSIIDHIDVHATRAEVHYNPACLVQMDGSGVRSELGWLPAPDSLRTARLVVMLPAPGHWRRRLAA